MKTLALYIISSDRRAGFWDDEKLDIGDGMDTQVATGFESEEAARAFLMGELAKIQAQPHFFKDAKLEAFPKTGEVSEYALSYTRFSPSNGLPYAVRTKFRVRKKYLRVVEEREASTARLH